MTTSRTTRLRLLWALVALAQLAVAVGGPVVDAALERGADRVAHVESESGDDCGVHHDHLFCQVCRTVALAGRDAAQVSGPCNLIRAEGAITTDATDFFASSAGLFSPLGSRAPPRA